MHDNTRLDAAILLARGAHAGQVDKVGMLYILHPLRVMLKGKNISEMIVGVLHDVMEDTCMGLAEIIQLVELTAKEAEALQLLTHEKNVPYADYVRNIKDSGNAIAINVKKYDVHDNASRAARSKMDKDVRERLLEKYSSALNILGVE